MITAVIYPFLRQFGHRGLMLNVYAVVAIVYGSGLLSGYHPTFSSAYNAPVFVYGIVFLVIGLFTLSWSFFRHDRWHYGVSVGWSAFWGLLLSSHWTLPFGWVAGISWYGIAAGLFLASAWPDAPRIPHLKKWEGLECEQPLDSSADGPPG